MAGLDTGFQLFDDGCGARFDLGEVGVQAFQDQGFALMHPPHVMFIADHSLA